MNLLYQNMDRMEERKANIYSQKHGEKKSQNKGNMKGGMNCKANV